jgi:hypothetical protein
LVLYPEGWAANPDTTANSLNCELSAEIYVLDGGANYALWVVKGDWAVPL